MTSVLNSLWQTISLSGEKAPTDTTTADTSQASDKDGFDTDKEDNQSTPKAEPQVIAPDVPSFELTEHTEARDRRETDVNSPTGRISPGTQSASNLAPPRSLQAPSRQPAPPRSSLVPAGLMPPPSGSSGPLPNRGPPGNSQQRVGSNARGKVLLSPGHSPMDWASLTRSSNLSGVPSLQRVTPSQLKVMNGRKGKPIWSSYQGKVYNITPYLPFHPGGEKELFKSAGRDGTKLFMDIHPWVNWEGMLSACLVGILVSEDAEGTLEDID
ncbi:hypothetical protein AMS68_003118 [Peltaster fructicola]|uniref:Cytochrome b5 heme-binding domain-containing protein n=1 Tax=Peltaster fructicola TaxID=286661 RepID=A0A6H0XSG8_9PEZI|nr:hypothetical protein AMS68_003118 [Peltaster fructicola]